MVESIERLYCHQQHLDNAGIFQINAPMITFTSSTCMSWRSQMLLKTSTVEDSSTFENYTQYLCCFHIAGTMGLGKKTHVAGCLALLLDESEAYRLLEGPRKKVVLL